MPGISVIVPVYQGEALIHSCVDSVQKQTFSDWELLIVNDHSTDNTAALCEAFAAKDNRIRVFHQETNCGVSAARNRGLLEAAGTYIAFLDADDRLEPDALQTLWDLREQTGADTAGCAHWNLTPDGNASVELLLPDGVYGEREIREKIVNRLLGDRLALPVFNGFIWRYLFSAELLRSAHMRFEGVYLEDELFLLEYFCHAKKLAVTETPLYRYFLNPSSATHRYMKNYMQTFEGFLQRKEQVVRRYGLETGCPHWRAYANWAGLIIAVGNEYAAGNPKSFREKERTVREICAGSEMSQAIAEITPTGLSRNKQIVADLIRGRHFFLLALLYRLKNRT